MCILGVALVLCAAPAALAQTSGAGMIVIDGGASWTISVNVTLELSASGLSGTVTTMRFSDDGSTWTAWEPYAASRAYALSPGDAADKTVWVEFENDVGDRISDFDTIGLDTAPPMTALTNRPRGVWINHSVVLKFAAVDIGGSGVDRIETNVGAAGWLVGDQLTIAAPGDHSNDGLKAILYRSVDIAGNVETAQRWTVGIDTRPPTSKALWAASVRRGDVATLKYAVVDAKPNAGGAFDRILIRRLDGTLVKSIDLHGQKVNVWLACRFRCTLAPGKYRFFVFATDAAGNRQSKWSSARLTVR
jgi:hypothetical protein